MGDTSGESDAAGVGSGDNILKGRLPNPQRVKSVVVPASEMITTKVQKLTPAVQDRAATSRDVIQLYNFLLRRDPENDLVIRNRIGSTLSNSFYGMVGSLEFAAKVVRTSAKKKPLAVPYMGSINLPELLDWAVASLPLQAETRAKLVSAVTWEDVDLALLQDETVTGTLGPLPVKTVLDELVSLRATVNRLEQVVNRVVSPTGDIQAALVRVLSERVAALTEVQRETVERELDALRAFAFQTSTGTIPAIAQEAGSKTKADPESTRPRQHKPRK
jgi:hypothetical protein